MISIDLVTTTSPVAREAALLALFAPHQSERKNDRIAPKGANHEKLWWMDTLHRAKNMVQLSTSLGNIIDRVSEDGLAKNMAVQARGLARVYDELSTEAEPLVSVPCTRILREVATRLVLIFGAARNISIAVVVDPIYLPNEQRRALVLICSELIINALKYGYPTNAGGKITVRLHEMLGGMEMMVEDDGIGQVQAYTESYGGDLIRKLAAVLGATVTRAPNAEHGFRVSVMFPTPEQRLDLT